MLLINTLITRGNKVLNPLPVTPDIVIPCKGSYCFAIHTRVMPRKYLNFYTIFKVMVDLIDVQSQYHRLSCVDVVP